MKYVSQKKAQRKQERLCNEWNANPVGTLVMYWKFERVEGEGKISRTRTPAQMLSGHTAVVWLEDVSGCISLSHIEKMPEIVSQ